MMKIRKGLFPNILNASNIKRVPKLIGFPFAGGGVAGKRKQRVPRPIADTAPKVKIFGLLDMPRPPTTKPAAIQPMVPQTRRAGNLLRSSMLEKATVLLNARVGI